MCTYMDTYINATTNVHIYIHAYKNTHIYTYTHAHMLTFSKHLVLSRENNTESASCTPATKGCVDMVKYEKCKI